MPCPNASTTLTIPLSGSAMVIKYDQSCNVLDGTKFQVHNGPNPAFPLVTAATGPAVIATAAGLSFSANGAAPGSMGTFTFVFTPNGLTDQMVYTVGAPVTSISSGTTAP